MSAQVSGSVMLRFTRSIDRKLLVLNGSQKLVGTLALVDIILAAQQNLTGFAGTPTGYETKSVN